MNTTFYTIRMDTRQPTALVLAPVATRPEKLEHFFDTADIHKHMQDNFGPDVKQLPGSKFREEVERRATHTLEMQALLMQHGTNAQDLINFYVYGTTSRPMGTWAGIDGAVYIQVDKSQTGYYTYVAVPAKLDAETLERCDLIFVSHPEPLAQSVKTVISRFKKDTIVAYRIQDNCYCHPECADEWPGEGEAITASQLVLEEDENIYFPGEYHNECTDRSVDNICCIGCGQWFNEDNRLVGVEAVVSRAKGLRKS